VFKNKSLTIVLPVHNAESRLRKNVRELLELASELTARFGVLIIDDGSTDATYEVAEELAAYFPQVSVRRHRECRGLGASIEYIQKRVRTDAVIVHDGVTPISSQQVRSLWRRWLNESTSLDDAAYTASTVSQDAIDIAKLSSIHASVEQVHRQVIGFQLLMPTQAANVAMNADNAATHDRPRTDASHMQKRAGLGRIPTLPRPKFFSALAEFAFGE
jgi:cellulose synthase/poly-beta-1,6-N-acetylglucosamine synthase-like glycosyltransferase